MSKSHDKKSIEQPFGEHLPRRHCIPILYTRGTHYEVGYDVVNILSFYLEKLLVVKLGIFSRTLGQHFHTKFNLFLENRVFIANILFELKSFLKSKNSEKVKKRMIFHRWDIFYHRN